MIIASIIGLCIIGFIIGCSKQLTNYDSVSDSNVMMSVPSNQKSFHLVKIYNINDANVDFKEIEDHYKEYIVDNHEEPGQFSTLVATKYGAVEMYVYGLGEDLNQDLIEIRSKETIIEESEASCCKCINSVGLCYVCPGGSFRCWYIIIIVIDTED